MYHVPGTVAGPCDTSVSTDLCPHCILAKSTMINYIVYYRKKRNKQQKEAGCHAAILNSGQNRPEMTFEQKDLVMKFYGRSASYTANSQ